MATSKEWVINMQKMKKGNIIIEIDKQHIERAKQIGYEVYNGYLVPNAEVDFNE